MKLALVHDHLNQIGGAEVVLKEFHKLWPEAPTYTLVYDKKLGDFFADKKLNFQKNGITFSLRAFKLLTS